MKKASRTISGVTPVAVMTAPSACPGKCIYCPTFADVPQSYTPKSPAVLRGARCDYDSLEQVKLRLRIFKEMGHPIDKVELIVMGGTFLATSQDYQYGFIKGCYDALNGTVAKNLEEAKKINETASQRCTGLCIETRPDYCGEEEVARMVQFGATRVELGVQVLDDEIYKLVKRGHGIEDVVKATKLLRESGLKIHYHWMPGLPGSSPKHDLEMTGKLFKDERFKPDGLKLYPTMVIEGTELAKWHQEGRYTPYDKETMLSLIIEMKKLVPTYVRLSRVLRDIPADYINAGLKDSLRDIVKKRMNSEGYACHCIRCREYGHRLKNGVEMGIPKLKRMDYNAAGGKEVFLSYEDDNGTLFGLLRLRVQDVEIPILEKGDNGKKAIIRELHIYGPEVALGRVAYEAVQHRGLGKSLLAKAERIAKEYGAQKVAVLSGVGARQYYYSEAYQEINGYMVKVLSA
ncbi:MAG: tRNA uridine(34) 5-carboxymethylaminomethyl modification radical SAM/GNAT enzyme Elp3 [Chloroflexi bacterium]|nr:tRNA uridine(34) 5-carboxymethylaminomethyl modification radical SAM/GNAT enzyme Elp3 [Chloroflexota bacterium]